MPWNTIHNHSAIWIIYETVFGTYRFVCLDITEIFIFSDFEILAHGG